eukprot:augustus_masked-scaffold_79-processed-gene-0.3-mRNA-1 protein AED:1.00 eAED:1.00 QI:0/0/0/0/1/1/8/0/1133
MEKVNKNRSEPSVLRSETGKKSGGRVVAEISPRNIITRDTETPQELNQVAVEESSSQGDMRDNSEVYRNVSDPGENMTTPDHVVVTRESWEQLKQNYETLQLQMSTLLQQVKTNISTGSNREVKKDLFRIKGKGKSRSEIEESDSENSTHSASSLSLTDSNISKGNNGGLRESERKRAREEKYKGKLVLRSLEPSKVAAFLEKFQVYETNVVRGRLKLPDVDISLCLSNQVQVMLQDEGVSAMRRRSAMKYLNSINKLQNKGKEKILMRKVESLVWSNEGAPMKSMTKFLKQVTDMVRGIRWETKSMEKESCLKVIRKLPFEFGSGNAKRTQSIKKWKKMGKLRRGLNKGSMVISESDLQSPALKLLVDESIKNKVNVGVMSDPVLRQRPKNPRGESNPPDGIKRTTLEDGSLIHFLPKTWSKRKRKQYGMDHNLCLFCYISNHRFDDCNEKVEAGETGSEDEESVFVGVVELLDVEEDYDEESGDFIVGSLDPVDLGEILVEDEFEVRGDTGKPHITDKKVAGEHFIESSRSFWVKIAKCDFNNLTPMKIELRERVAESVSKPYPIFKVTMEALKNKLRELEDMGMIRREPNPFFSSPVIMVSKPGKRDEYRMVLDRRVAIFTDASFQFWSGVLGLWDSDGLKTKLVDSNGDAGWRIRWKGITLFANSDDVDAEKMEIANMIGGPDGEEVLEVEVNKVKGNQELKMLTIPEIIKVQEECEISLNKMEASRNESGAWISKQGKVIIPGELIERFIVTAHNASGHGSVDEVMRILEPFFFIDIPRNKQKILVQNLKKWCLHCDRDIKMIRRPLREIYHPSEGELVLHLDFFKVKESYILVILENVSRKVLLIEDPILVVEGEHCYRVESIGGKEQVVHLQRMILYRSKSEDFKVTSDIKHSFYYNQGPYYVKKLLDLRNTIDGFEVLIWWEGFTKSNANWQSMRRLYEDVPQIVKEFIRKNKDDTIDFENAHKLIKKWERVLNVRDVNNPRLILQDIKKMIKFINDSKIEKEFKESVNHIEDNATEVTWPRDNFRSSIGNKWYKVLIDSGAGISCIGSNMVSSTEMEVEGEELARLSNVFEVIMRKLEIIGYAWKEIKLVHTRVKVNLGRVCLYVLERSMNKIIVREKVLKKIN